MRSFPVLFALTLMIALLAFLQPFLLRLAYAPPPTYIDPTIVIFSNMLAAGIWVLLIVFGITVHRKRGLWLLVGAPFALFWAAGMTWIYLVCTFGPECM